MRKVSVLIQMITALAFIFTVAGCGDDDDICIRGSGNLSTYDDIQVSQFNRISVSGPININITQGATTDLIVRAEPELFEILEIESSGSELNVGFPRNAVCIDTELGVFLDVTVPDLELIRVSGASNIRTITPVAFNNLVVDISGEADLEMTGNVQDMRILCSGAVTARNFGLTTNIQRLDISGAADVELQCDIELAIVVSGAAVVRYRGMPQISQNVSGSLELINAN